MHTNYRIINVHTANSNNTYTGSIGINCGIYIRHYIGKIICGFCSESIASKGKFCFSRGILNSINCNLYLFLVIYAVLFNTVTVQAIVFLIGVGVCYNIIACSGKFNGIIRINCSAVGNSNRSIESLSFLCYSKNISIKDIGFTCIKGDKVLSCCAVIYAIIV